MLWFALAIVVGIALLVWSADRFVDGASATANHLGLSSLFIGMVVIGFGTSAPEMIVSALAALDGAPALALGNAYGSNIANLALILGCTAAMAPIVMQSQIVRREIPVLIGVSFASLLLLLDKELSRYDAILLLGIFVSYVVWAYASAKTGGRDELGKEIEKELPRMSLGGGLFWLLFGLALLMASSKLLVWGAVGIASALGVSDLVIGLTILAVGTSLPELASSIIAARKNEHDIALGNIIGSNMFNTLAVVGIAGAIKPATVPAELLTRDMPVMLLLTCGLILLAVRGRNHREISRGEGGILLAVFAGYTSWLLLTL